MALSTAACHFYFSTLSDTWVGSQKKGRWRSFFLMSCLGLQISRTNNSNKKKKRKGCLLHRSRVLWSTSVAVPHELPCRVICEPFVLGKSRTGLSWRMKGTVGPGQAGPGRVSTMDSGLRAGPGPGDSRPGWAGLLNIDLCRPLTGCMLMKNSKQWLAQIFQKEHLQDWQNDSFLGILQYKG